MLDSAVWSKSPHNGSDIHVKFVDWLPFIFSSLGMLIINSVEKQRLSADSFSYSGNGVAWKARVVLFLVECLAVKTSLFSNLLSPVFPCLLWVWALRTWSATLWWA